MWILSWARNRFWEAGSHVVFYHLFMAIGLGWWGEFTKPLQAEPWEI